MELFAKYGLSKGGVGLVGWGWLWVGFRPKSAFFFHFQRCENHVGWVGMRREGLGRGGPGKVYSEVQDGRIDWSRSRVGQRWPGSKVRTNNRAVRQVRPWIEDRRDWKAEIRRLDPVRSGIKGLYGGDGKSPEAGATQGHVVYTTLPEREEPSFHPSNFAQIFNVFRTEEVLSCAPWCLELA